MASLQTWDEIVADSFSSVNTLREELMDAVYNLTPMETPILSSLTNAKVNSRFPQWLQDAYRSAATNAVVEDATFSATSKTVPTRADNIVQSVYVGGQITDVQRAVDHAGVGDPLSYYQAKDVMELKRDVELALVRGSAVTGTTGTACQMNGILNVASSNKTNLSGATFTETVFNDIVELTWTNSKRMPTRVYTSPKLRRTISLYSTKVTHNIDADTRRQILSTNVYDNDFGLFALETHRDLTNGTDTNELFAIDPTYMATGWLKPMMSEPLARDGLRDRYQLSAHLTLLYRHEKAIAVVTNAQYYIP